MQLTADEMQLVKQNNIFAFNLFRQTRDGNTVLSPLSITYALGMVNNGAAGQTQKEINNVLGFSDAGAEGINKFCLDKRKLTESLDPETKVMIANNIYVNSGYVLQSDFVSKAKTYYDATPETRDFGDGKTLDVINQWANDHTEGMIPEVLNNDTFNPNAVSYLLNAIYFKGEWTFQFLPEQTEEEPFDNQDNIPVMRMFEELKYAENDTYQTLSLPYGNGSFCMTLFLPREGQTLDDVLNALGGEQWAAVPSSLKTYRVDVKLPRFETNTDVKLNDVMAALGMPSAFDRGMAEFPYFCNVPVFIALMKQTARIRVNESGTEAAAVTVVGMEKNGMSDIPSAKFYATKPFLYVISEQSTGAILFMGQFVGNQTMRVDTPYSAQRANGNRMSDNKVYSLDGRQLGGQPSKGIFIRNGRKIVKGE